MLYLQGYRDATTEDKIIFLIILMLKILPLFGVNISYRIPSLLKPLQCDIGFVFWLTIVFHSLSHISFFQYHFQTDLYPLD